MEEYQQEQEASMTHTSAAGAIIGTVGAVGMSMAVFNNGYRLGRMGNLLSRGKNTEIVNKLVEGEKIAGNFKLPFTDLTTRGGIGEKINIILRGSPEAVGGFGFSKGHKSLLGLSEGRGLGYNFSFDKRILDDIESGVIDKDLLKKNFLERHAVLDKEGKFLKGKKKNLTKEEFSSLLNDSVNKEKYFIEESATKKINKKATNEITRSIIDDLEGSGKKFTKKERVLINKEFKKTMFNKEGSDIFTSKITQGAFKESIANLEKQGIKIAEKEVLKVAENSIEKKLAVYAGKKVAKYAALTPMLAAGPYGAAVAGVIGAGFAIYDTISVIAGVSELNKELYKAKKEEATRLSAAGRVESFDRINNQKSMGSISSGFQSLQQANFGLSNLLRTKNMAGSFLSDKL